MGEPVVLPDFLDDGERVPGPLELLVLLEGADEDDPNRSEKLKRKIKREY
jgi:hypothetical protein